MTKPAKNAPATLEEWTRRLSEEDMPVFAHTARRMAGISSDAESSVGDLAQIILQDSTMTARVLRMANSAYYNPAGRSISTVSRAIVMLGFNVVRTISLSIAMVDTLLSGIRHERMVQEMARSFHAAAQAWEFAGARNDQSPEEVFIAALLYRFGHMTFWCFPYGYENEMDALLLRGDADEASVERRVLGFALIELSAQLNHEWHLSHLLDHLYSGDNRNDPRVRNIELGYQIADAAAREGWESDSVKEAIEKTAEYLYMPYSKTLDLVHENAKHATAIAAEFGADIAGRLIPIPHKPAIGSEADEDKAGADAAQKYKLQLSILRELSAMLSERVDLNTLLGTVLEGVYRGVDMDRAVLAIVSRDGKQMAGKYSLGRGSEYIANCFNFSLGADGGGFMNAILHNKEPLWLFKPGERTSDNFAAQDVMQCIGLKECFVMPITVQNKPKGVIYADRGVTNRRLDEESFATFRHFCEHIVIGLSMLAS
jgi:HD-like signal output (HDOD) protein